MARPLSIQQELPELDLGQTSALNRRTQAWLVLLVVLVLVSAFMLALYLRTEETREVNRQRAEDTAWLEQSMAFHFRRLESDLAALAYEIRKQGDQDTELAKAGSLWRSTGVVTALSWVPPSTAGRSSLSAETARKLHVTPAAHSIMDIMLDTVRALQRPTYAGPLTQADNPSGHLLWLAVPVSEEGRFSGSYVAAIDLEKALAATIPSWFYQDHQIRLLGTDSSPADALVFDPMHYVVPVNLYGAELRLHVDTLASHPQLAPRAFFGIAILGLLGTLLALYLFFRDTVKRKSAESQLSTQIALRTAMERSVTLGLRAWDLQGRLLYVNQAFCRMVGRDHASLKTDGENAPYWPVHQGNEFTKLQSIASRADLQALGTECQLLRSDGQALEVLMHYAPLTLANGTPIGWICSTLDISDRRQAERHAQRQQEVLEASARLIAVGAVASTLAHELNQPLGALSSFSNGLLNRLALGNIALEEIPPVVARIEKMAEKAGRVIQRVNAFARRQEMTRQPLDLLAFVLRVSQSISTPDGVKLASELPTTPHWIEADALLLEHALSNLVQNACEWAAQQSPGKGEVCIRIAQADQHTGIAVEDNGPGVSPDKRTRIFDAFTSHKLGGMGMGLSICRSIVEAHRGRIEVGQSSTLGGAQFTIWLPDTLQAP